MPARMDFSLSFGPGGAAPGSPRRQEGPCKLLLLGDFSGLPTAERGPLAGRRTWAVDIDNVESVMQKIAPRLRLQGVAGDIALPSIDHFHPDQLLANLDMFRALRDMRARLAHPASFAAAAAELRGAAPDPAAAAAPAAADDGDLLGRLLGKPVGAPAATPAPTPPAAPTDLVDAWVKRLVAPHIVREDTPFQAQYLASVDLTIAEQMRAVLHAPAFQALEAAWRGVFMLVSALDLDDTLQLQLLDVNREEMLADVVGSGGQLDRTALHQALVEKWRDAPDGEPWTALLCLHDFGPSDADIGLLAALGLIAARAGGPLLAAAQAALLGVSSFASAAAAVPAAPAGWQALRRSQAAPWLGLLAPRLLMRLPYGRSGERTEAFAFEEFAGTPDHEAFLWGSGALAAALLIGRAFARNGWPLDLEDERDITDLPSFIVEHDGERVQQACAEAYLSEGAWQALLAQGVMPLLSHRQRNAVRLPRLQSIAEPVQALAGLGVS